MPGDAGVLCRGIDGPQCLPERGASSCSCGVRRPCGIGLVSPRRRGQFTHSAPAGGFRGRQAAIAPPSARPRPQSSTPERALPDRPRAFCTDRCAPSTVTALPPRAATDRRPRNARPCARRSGEAPPTSTARLSPSRLPVHPFRAPRRRCGPTSSKDQVSQIAARGVQVQAVSQWQLSEPTED